jgi:hypothetical protein
MLHQLYQEDVTTMHTVSLRPSLHSKTVDISSNVPDLRSTNTVKKLTKKPQKD